MIYLHAFIFCGLVCAIGQIILENTKMTPGDLNTILVISGVILSAMGLYDMFIKWAGGGATMPIMNFGHVVFQGAYNGFKQTGLIGLLNGLLSSSAILSTTIIISFLVTIFFKPKH